VPARLIAAIGAGAFLVSGVAPPSALFHIADPRIDEASGIALGIAAPGVVYVQNDSGDSARFFALDAHTGKTLATYDVPGATNVDWEDIAVARDRRGVPSVWLGDIGDNDSKRSEIRVYRVDEPRAGATTTTAPEIWRLRYPGGPVDAESLAVAPGGAAYVLTQSIFGATDVYAVPSRSDPARVQVLRRIGEIDFHPTGTPGGPNVIGQVTATGAALSRDGSLLAVRTYTDAYVWPVRNGDVARAVKARPARVALPRQPQGEGIAVDGTRLLVDSEQVGSAVYAVALPLPPIAANPPRPTTTPHAAPPRHDIRSFPWPVVLGLIAAGLVAAVLLARRVSRRLGS
jgi:hypothetical protein